MYERPRQDQASLLSGRESAGTEVGPIVTYPSTDDKTRLVMEPPQRLNPREDLKKWAPLLQWMPTL